MYARRAICDDIGLFKVDAASTILDFRWWNLFFSRLISQTEIERFWVVGFFIVKKKRSNRFIFESFGICVLSRAG